MRTSTTLSETPTRRRANASAFARRSPIEALTTNLGVALELWTQRPPFLQRSLNKNGTDSCGSLSGADVQGNPKVHSRPFDPHRCLRVADVQACLDLLIENLAAAEARSRRRSVAAQQAFAACVSAIVLDLYCAYLSDPEMTVGVAAGQSRLQAMARSRYHPGFIAPRPFRSAFKALLGAGYIVLERRGFFSAVTGKGEVARVRASRALIDYLEVGGMSIASIGRHPGAEGIVLKDVDKNRVDYGDVPFANDARTRLAVINGRLARHWYDLDVTDRSMPALALGGEREGEASHPLDLSARQLYRVFNDGDWDSGGRFYGAWWQSVPKAYRRFIVIDDKPTVELDYSGLHAAMLFAEAGASDDPYARCFPGDSSFDLRSMVKRAFNALLNARSVDSLSEMSGYDPDRTGMHWKQFKKHVIECFPEIQSSFGTGIGVRLQRKDSDLAERVMLRFCEMGYPCLPVHDSFIVHYALEDDLRMIMQSEFQRVLGSGIGVTVKRSCISYDTSDGYIMEDIGSILQQTGPYQRFLSWHSQ